MMESELGEKCRETSTRSIFFPGLVRIAFGGGKPILRLSC